ncbi:hypothetical protein GQ43DRAFT_379613 [Delitschia confertaspora ATCC 74209]|uniref:Uncharacterized protein n=1 Tax=Delitschia confertaspora ATCC 74209 TaxID=1513339 RepID=A0A9P4MVH8_9PLEO|nr:hypothetical protein GQ43DRAFT_379613 [Delitschia confertaspora ATCC 74209]
MATSRPQAGSHGRLHKRGHSASSINSPLSHTTNAFTFNRSETPKVTYEEPWHEPTRPVPAATSSKPLKIKPYLRKLSSKDSNGLDLSRPSAENEGLAGLGISDHDGNPRSVTDVNFTPVNGRHRHNRSVSNTSQFSTSSSLQRPTVPRIPSYRQTSGYYTPPITQSTPPSIMGSDNEDYTMTDEEFRLRQNMFDPARRSGSLSSVPGVSPALPRLQTNGSSTRLGSYSQSSLSLASPVGPSRSRGDTLKSLDTTSPSSRTSFDKAFGFIRGGRDSPVDPASRAASLHAARQAFAEKEAAKERKYEEEANKQAERENRKRYKEEERLRRKSESSARIGNYPQSMHNEKAGRPSVGARQYSDHREAHTRSLPIPAQAAPVDPEKGIIPTPKVTRSRAAKGRWLRFVAWFKTRLLRIGRKLHVSS